MVRPATWAQVARAVVAPLNWLGSARRPRRGRPLAAPIRWTRGHPRRTARDRPGRGPDRLFGALFVTADSAFADLTGDLLSAPADPLDVVARVGGALLVVAVAFALVWAARPRPLGPQRHPGRPAGRS